jgi:hypothetical protein
MNEAAMNELQETVRNVIESECGGKLSGKSNMVSTQYFVLPSRAIHQLCIIYYDSMLYATWRGTITRDISGDFEIEYANPAMIELLVEFVKGDPS